VGILAEVKRKPRTRGNGQGTAYKLPSGKWRAEVTLGWEKVKDEETGKERKKRVYTTKSGFKRKCDALSYIEQYRNGTVQQQKKVTFKELYDKWEPTHNRSKSTMDCYAAAMKHFKPIWYFPVTEIDIDDLQECVDDCPKGKRTKENMKAVAGLLYAFGIPRHCIKENLNLAKYIQIRESSDESRKPALTLQDVEKIKKKIGKVKYADYVYAHCYLGFRPSEFLALDAANYNAKEKAFVGGAKTEAGTDRTVTISPKIQSIIDKLTKGKTAGAVFCDKDGSPMPVKTYRKAFYAVLDTCGIDNPTTMIDGAEHHRLTPHSCRHTFATLMKRVEGADKDKLELMGHTSSEMLRYYQDVNFDDLRKITDNL